MASLNISFFPACIERAVVAIPAQSQPGIVAGDLVANSPSVVTPATALEFQSPAGRPNVSVNTSAAAPVPVLNVKVNGVLVSV